MHCSPTKADHIWPVPMDMCVLQAILRRNEILRRTSSVARLDDHCAMEFLPISASPYAWALNPLSMNPALFFWMADDVLDMYELLLCLRHFGIDKQLQDLLSGRDDGLLFGWRRQQLIHSVNQDLVVGFRRGPLGKPRLTLL